MTGHVIALRGPETRQRAVALIAAAPDGTRLELKPPRRTLPQNARMWAMLTEISHAVTWHGRKLAPADWKDVFTAALRRADVVPNLDGTGFVALGLRTSDMGKAEMSDMLELIAAFAAARKVSFPWDIPDV